MPDFPNPFEGVDENTLPEELREMMRRTVQHFDQMSEDERKEMEEKLRKEIGISDADRNVVVALQDLYDGSWNLGEETPATLLGISELGYDMMFKYLCLRAVDHEELFTGELDVHQLWAIGVVFGMVIGTRWEAARDGAVAAG